MLKNEIFSFQVACWIHCDFAQRIPCSIKVISELAPYISIYSVGYVPNLLPTIDIDADDDYLSKNPGLFPDPLFKVSDGIIDLANGQTRMFWIAIKPNGRISGNYPIRIQIMDAEERFMEEMHFDLQIINALLPELPIKNTSWLHGDCIASIHHVDVNSEEYFAIVEKYLKVYAKFGHNMVLTPVFTPPLGITGCKF